MAWAPEGVASVRAEDLGVSVCECVVKGKLDRRRGRAAVFAMKGAKIERRRFAVRPDDGLPNATITAKKIVLILDKVKETGFGVCKGRGGRGKTIRCCSSESESIRAMPGRPGHLMEYLKTST